MSLQSLGSSGRIDTGFGNETSLSSTGSGFGNGSGFGLSTDVDSFSTKSKGLCLFYFIVNRCKIILLLVTSCIV